MSYWRTQSTDSNLITGVEPTTADFKTDAITSIKAQGPSIGMLHGMSTTDGLVTQPHLPAHIPNTYTGLACFKGGICM